MALELLMNGLWNAIKRFFPQWLGSPRGGRPAIDNRIILAAILLVLRTGLAWADLPREIFLLVKKLACGHCWNAGRRDSGSIKDNWAWFQLR